MDKCFATRSVFTTAVNDEYLMVEQADKIYKFEEPVLPNSILVSSGSLR